MSTEEERLARKQLEIEKLQAKSERMTKELYHQLDLQIETDEQKALLEKYKALDKKIDRVQKRYWQTSEQLYEEREKLFIELTDSLEMK